MSRIMGFIHDDLARRGHHVDYYCADDVPARWRTSIGRRFAFPQPACVYRFTVRIP